MKISLLTINVIVFLYSGFMTILALSTLGLGGSGISGNDPVLIGTFVMSVSSLVGIIGMMCTFKRVIRTLYYIFATIGILIPAVIFIALSSYFGN